MDELIKIWEQWKEEVPNNFFILYRKYNWENILNFWKLKQKIDEHKINSIMGLKAIKRDYEYIAIRIKRENKYQAVYLSDMTALEFIDVLIEWIDKDRKIVYKVKISEETKL